jgi:oleandomycin transport system permease protein
MIWIMPLTFGSTVFLSSSASMPGWLQAWVKVNPVTQLVDSVRALTLGGPVGDHVLYTLAWSAGVILVTFPLAVYRYTRRA